MATGDMTFDGSMTTCGCSRFIATATGRRWSGNMMLLWDDSLSGLAKIVYFESFSVNYVRWTDADYISHNSLIPVNGGSLFDPFPSTIAEQTDYNVSASALYGTPNTFSVNPYQIGVRGGAGFNWSRIRLSQVAAVGSYIFRSRNNIQSVDFSPGPKYSFSFDTDGLNFASAITSTGPYGTNGGGAGGRFNRYSVTTYSGEHTEAEFDIVLRKFLNDAAFNSETFRLERDDRFPCIEIATGGQAAAGSGHACRLITHRADSVYLPPNPIPRGYGILRKCTIGVPGHHSLKSYSSMGEYANPLPKFVPSDDFGFSEMGFKTISSSRNDSPTTGYGTLTNCENITIGCSGTFTVDAPTTNTIRDWRAGEVCPP